MAEPRWPVYAAWLSAAAYIPAVQSGVYHPSGNSVLDGVVFLITAPAVAALSLALGLLPGRTDSVIGLVVATVAFDWGDPNPFPVMITVGFWLVGLSVRSHRRLAEALHSRAYELESSREAYAQEALRYEHSRIARELHDIVAHSLSVIVIQASAGRRLPVDDPGAPELFDTITELTDQVRADISGLTRLLDESGGCTASLTRQSIDGLLTRTTATGSPIECHLADDLDQLPGRLGTVVYRVLQEGLTNAIKYAPGAPIDVTIAAAANIRVVVTNGAARTRPTAPAVPGAGRGLAGLTERVRAVNGTFTSGPTPQGGWQLSAELPS